MSKEREAFETHQFAYAKVERGLAVMLGADDATMRGSLRARLKRLSTLKLLDPGPGKGERRQYSRKEVYILALALLLMDGGVDPIRVVPALLSEETWKRIEGKIRQAAECPDDNPMMLYCRVRAISGLWTSGDPLAALPWISIAQRFDDRSIRRRVSMYRAHLKTNDPAVLALIDKLSRMEADNLLMAIDRDDESGWISIRRNLTADFKRLHATLHTRR